MDRFKEICEKIKLRWEEILIHKSAFDDFFESTQRNHSMKDIEEAHMSISRFHQKLMMFKSTFGGFIGNRDKLKLMWQTYTSYSGNEITPHPTTLKINLYKKANIVGREYSKIVGVGEDFLDHGLFSLWHVYPADTFTIVGFTNGDAIILLYKGDNKKYNNKTVIITKEDFNRMFI